VPLSMKISACILSRDDSSTLRECLSSIRPHVDELIVTDTGSSDDSPKIARECGADRVDFYVACNDPETNQIMDFAQARNHAMGLATCDFHAWFDADDVVVGAEHLRTLASQRPAESVMWLMPYEYQHDPLGRVTVLHHRENLVYPTRGFEWKTPVHEVLIPKAGTPPPTVVAAPQVRRIHRKQLSRRAPDPQRNLRILRRYVQQSGEGDVRALYYLGVEFSNHGMIGDAFRTLRRYEKLSKWDDERCLALLELARLYQMVGDFELAIEWAQKAMTAKSWPEPYWTLAECFYALASPPISQDVDQNFRRCAHFAGLGMSLPEAETVLFTNPTKRAEIHRIYSIALFKSGMVEQALASVRAGLERLPEDPVLRQNAAYFETITTQQSVLTGLNRLHALGSLPADRAQLIVAAMSGAPLALPSTPTATIQPPAPAPQAAEPGCLDVVFFVGPGFEPWNPDTFARGGLGGSETMAWELARRLRRLGHRVRLFGHCGPDAPEGVFEGVEWMHADRYPGTECDVLISSRQATAVDAEFGVKTRLRLLWIHDVHAGAELNQRRALRFDRILALSKWHQELLWQVYPHMDPAKVFVTRNGLDPARFEWPESQWGKPTMDVYIKEHDRIPTKVVYSSSPDRGLPCLLELWPYVLKEEPDAELHVFYGSANLEKEIAMTGNAEIAAMHRRTLAMVKSMPSVKMRGRVNQTELAGEMLSAGVWVLPGGFTETSCIGAAEAQAAGCHIVCSGLAALNETVAERGTLVRGEVMQQTRMPPDQPEEYKREFAAAVVAAIRAARNGPNEAGMKWARESFGLDSLATEWDAMLRGLLAEVDRDVVPKFREVRL